MAMEIREPKASDFRKGDRVRIRRDKLAQWHRKPEKWASRLGVVTGSQTQVSVRWDGNKSAEGLWAGWLEVVK